MRKFTVELKIFLYLIYLKITYSINVLIKDIMKNSKQHQKLNNLQVKAEKCLSRKEAKKILVKAIKAQDKINY